MGIEIPRGSSELGAVGHRLEVLYLGLDPVNEDHDLLAHARRGCWLPVGAGEEGHVSPPPSVRVEHAEDLGELGEVDAAVEVEDHEGVAGVVDVLRGKAEVDELLDLGQLLHPRLRRHLRQPPLDEVLHSLHVVVGGEGWPPLRSSLELRLLHPLCVLVREVEVYTSELLEESWAGLDLGELGEGRLHGEQRDEVLDLNMHAVLDVGELREMV
mmetsp:Transcript_11209/g.38174  ORF Transcript_11209/g.38174 Transcript_11209/m.38174 type:complete len:213 (-) Transcript_11209:65-703(-)